MYYGSESDDPFESASRDLICVSGDEGVLSRTIATYYAHKIAKRFLFYFEVTC